MISFVASASFARPNALLWKGSVEWRGSFSGALGERAHGASSSRKSAASLAVEGRYMHQRSLTGS